MRRNSELNRLANHSGNTTATDRTPLNELSNGVTLSSSSCLNAAQPLQPDKEYSSSNCLMPPEASQNVLAENDMEVSESSPLVSACSRPSVVEGQVAQKCRR